VDVSLPRERDGYLVTFNIEEGQPFTIASLNVETDLPDIDIEAYQNAITTRPGATYSPVTLERDIERLEQLAQDQGLRFVRVDPDVSRNDRDLSLDVTYKLVRGERVFIERIDIEGNTTTLDRVIRNQFRLAEGDPFNPRAIRESAERIRALGYFATADVQAREGSTPQQVIVDVDVEEQPTGALSFGANYSTTNGIGLAISFSERNFLGRGQSFSFGVNTASSSKNYSLSFAEPNFLGRDLTFGISTSYATTDSQNADFDTTSGVIRPFVAFPVSDNSRLQLRYTFNYRKIELNSGATVGGIITNEAAAGGRSDSSLGYTYSYDTRRTGLNPNAGFLFEFGQDFAGLGGDVSYVKTSVRGVAQTKAFNEEVTLRASLNAGSINFRSGDNSITGDRFRLSPDTMRGFEFGGIGPREIGTGVNDSIGGNQYVVASFEAEFPLGLPEEYGITGGVFYDVGSVWGVNDNAAALATGAGNTLVSSDFELRHVVGFTVFWDSVLGPLRLNFSEPLKKNANDQALNFNLSISTKF
jgi:outer membrane protein insertion porin family